MTFKNTETVQTNDGNNDSETNPLSPIYLGISTLNYETLNIEKFKSVVRFNELNDDQIIILLRWAIRKDALSCFEYLVNNYDFKDGNILTSTSLSENVQSMYQLIFSSDDCLTYIDYLLMNTILTKKSLLKLNPLSFCWFTHNSRKNNIKNVLTFLNIGKREIMECSEILVHCAENAHHAFIILWNLMIGSTNSEIETEYNLENIVSPLLDKLMGSIYQTNETICAITHLLHSSFYSLNVYETCKLDLLTYSVYLGNISLIREIITKTPGLEPDHIKNPPSLLFRYILETKNNEVIMEIISSFYKLDLLLKDSKDVHKIITLLINH